MKINGIEFSFSAANAKDLERMEAAHLLSEKESAAEKLRIEKEHITSLPEIIRGQCKIVMNFIDRTLGDGASQKLGLDGNDLNDCKRVCSAILSATQNEYKALGLYTAARVQRNAL